jgi:PAS domain S-box-containing protein
MRGHYVNKAQASGDIMESPKNETPSGATRSSHVGRTLWRLTICTITVVAIASVLSVIPLRDRPLSAALSFLFAVLIASAFWGFRYAVFVSLFSALAFWWLLPPVGRFVTSDARNVYALVAFLVIGIVTSHLSASARKEALSANRSARELRDLIERIPIMALSVRPDGSTEFSSRRWHDYAGSSEYSTVSGGRESTIHPDDADEHSRKWQAALDSGQRFESEVRHRSASGEYRWFLMRAVPVRDQQGNVLKWYGTLTDIEDRKRTEQALRRSEAYLAEAEKLSHAGSWAFNASRIVYWSEENYRIWGFDPQRAPPDRETVLQRIHPEDRERVYELARNATLEGRDYAVEFRIVLPDGSIRYIHGLGHPILGARGELVEVVGTQLDVTERKRAERERERLRQLQADLAHMNRVTMMGELAASLAHEIKQPLAAAGMNASACMRWLRHEVPDVVEASEAASRVIRDANLAAEIVDRVRSLYQRGTPQRALVDVNEIIREMTKLLQHEAARRAVALRNELAEDLPRVLADRVQVQQVLMNLMLNGIEAMKDAPGELTVRSRRLDDGQVLIAVRDAGVGLPAEHLEQIFESFVTTKTDGTGMGLSISRTIVESHGGRLWASPNVERGATFQFTLPSESADVSRADAGQKVLRVAHDASAV